MSGGIFLIQGEGGLVEMREQPYGSEDVIQELLAKYPNLLAGDQMDGAAPRRWLLITREMGVPDTEDGGDRWSLDHLFLDQDAVPTLVEVKRSSDTRIRREVIGQMLDYAANAVVYWPVEAVRSRFEEGCRSRGADPAAELEAFLGPGAATEEFWQRAKTNLQAGRVRLVFVADVIPPELRRVVEFLNGQMDPAEVLAVEVKQFVGGGMKTLVPRVIGQTSGAERKKGTAAKATRQWDEASFFADLTERRGGREATAARAILTWAKSNVSRVWWGKGTTEGSFIPLLEHGGVKHFVVNVWSYGQLEIPFQWMLGKSPFDDEGKRLELLKRLNALPGVNVPEARLKGRPSVPLLAVADDAAMKAFLAILDWYVGEVKAA